MIFEAKSKHRLQRLIQKERGPIVRDQPATAQDDGAILAAQVTNAHRSDRALGERPLLKYALSLASVLLLLAILAGMLSTALLR